MTSRNLRILISAVAFGGAMTFGAGAVAYWGGPWDGDWGGPGGGPWGGGPYYPYGGYGGRDLIHQRQVEMRDHEQAMRDVGHMLSGRRPFDRVEATRLAREIEATAGENLWRMFRPGDWRMGSRSSSIIWGDMDRFKSHAEALKAAAGQLADELEKRPTAEEYAGGKAVVPDWRLERYGAAPWEGGPYSRWGNRGGAVTKEVYDAYLKLEDTCHGCHANFRSPWY